MINPKTNFDPDFTDSTEDEKWKYMRSVSFFIRTVTFDLQKDGYADIITSNYESSLVKNWLQEMNSQAYTSLNNTYFVGVDTYPWNDIRPILKCAPPCYTCLESRPDYCLSCWGRDSAPGFRDYFLQPGVIATCKNRCDDKFTTNGGVAEFKTA